MLFISAKKKKKRRKKSIEHNYLILWIQKYQRRIQVLNIMSLRLRFCHKVFDYWVRNLLLNYLYFLVGMGIGRFDSLLNVIDSTYR